ncbi:MAG: hypothetical protein QOD77_407 [Thermoplasmata archaeon]|jgi:hypothetical protein|nr:hypothetical protein [Thermoplasmata archaeon]
MRHQPAGRVVFEAATEGSRIAVLHLADGYRAVKSVSYPGEGGDWVRSEQTFAMALAHFDGDPWHAFAPVTVDPSIQDMVRQAWQQRAAAAANAAPVHQKRWRALLD